MKSRKEFGEFLRESREGANVSQLEIAKKLGWKTAQFVSNLERGICNFPMASAKKYCRVINLPPHIFLQTRASLLVAVQQKQFNKGVS